MRSCLPCYRHKKLPGNGQFNCPYDVAVSSDNCVYVADYGNYRIQKFDSTGNYILKWTVSVPYSIAVSGNNSIFVGGDSYIKLYDSSGNLTRQIASSGSGDGNVYSTQTISADKDGNVYTLDSGNSKMKKFDSNGNFVTKWSYFPSIGGEDIAVGDNSMYVLQAAISVMEIIKDWKV